jgi:hypothetical protein
MVGVEVARRDEGRESLGHGSGKGRKVRHSRATNATIINNDDFNTFSMHRERGVD